MLTRNQIEDHLAAGGIAVEEVSGKLNPDRNFRLEWSDPSSHLFHNTPARMARHLWERQQWLGTTLTLVETAAEVTE